MSNEQGDVLGRVTELMKPVPMRFCRSKGRLKRDLLVPFQKNTFCRLMPNKSNSSSIGRLTGHEVPFMWLGVISLLPEMFDAVSDDGVFGRALSSGRLSLNRYNPRDFTQDKHRTVDDRPYGDGPGMVMMVEPLRLALAAAKADAPANTKVVLMSPQGQQFDQGLAVTESALPGNCDLWALRRYR